jgi:hypothetical protein
MNLRFGRTNFGLMLSLIFEIFSPQILNIFFSNFGHFFLKF